MTGPRIGICSWSLRPGDPHHLVEMVRSLDVHGVQLALNPLIESPEIWADAIDLLRRAGLEVLSGMMAMAGEDYSTLESIARTGGVRPDATWPTNFGLATQVAPLAASHQIDLVTFHAGFLPELAESTERHTMLDRLHLIDDAFAPRHVGLAFETGQESAATLRSVLAELRRPNVGVNFDPANMILYGMGDPVQALADLTPHVRQIHIKDAVASVEPGTWGREVPVGTGDVDWPAFFKLARAIEPPVNYLIEREAGGERLADIQQAVEVIREHG